MKKLILLAVFVLMIFASCSENKEFVVNGKNTVIKPYGIFNMKTANDSIVYELSMPDVVLSAVFSETLVVPLVSCGFYLWEPISKK